MKSVTKKHVSVFLILVLFFVALGLFTGPNQNVVSAAEGDPLGYTPLAPLPGIGDTGPISSLPNYLISMFQLLIGVAAALAVIMITLGGIEYMSTDSMFGKNDGKHKIEQALLGLLLAVSAWLILHTINPATLEFRFNPTLIPAPTAPPAPQDAFYKVETCVTREATATEPEEKTIQVVAVHSFAQHGSAAAAELSCRTTSPYPGARISDGTRDRDGCWRKSYVCTTTRP